MPKEQEKRKNKLKECGGKPALTPHFSHAECGKKRIYTSYLSEIVIFFEKKLDFYNQLCIINVGKVRNFLTEARLKLKMVDFADEIVRTPERRML